jgi:hypothetical protein
MTKDEVDVIRLRAAHKVQAAIRKGLLPRITKETKCVDCGCAAYGYDHRDYYKPLEVEPVCRKCNAKRGPGNPVPDDWNENNGKNWGGLNDGEGEQWVTEHPIHTSVDWKQIEFDLELARRVTDPDVVIADRELWKMGKKTPYKPIGNKEVWINQTLYQIRHKMKWDKHERKLKFHVVSIGKSRLLGQAA